MIKVICCFLIGAQLALATSEFYLGGIAVNEPDHHDWVQSLKAAQMNTVEVTVYAKQGDWDSDHLWYENQEPYVISEIRAAKQAGLKVVLILRVALDHAFERNKFLWHGMIMPKDDELLASWFNKYQSFAIKWAKISQEEGVDVLGIGSEMRMLVQSVQRAGLPDIIEFYLNESKQEAEYNKYMRYEGQIPQDSLWVRGHKYTDLSLYLKDKQAAQRVWAKQVGFLNYTESNNKAKIPVQQINERSLEIKQYWKSVIKSVRSEFKGKLTYAANFDNYHLVGFWSDLDILGINAYFPLRFQYNNEQWGKINEEQTSPETPETAAKFANLEEELIAGWQDVYSSIESVKKKNDINPDMPLWFTELGYIYRENCTYAPWAGFGHAVVGAGDNERLLLYNQEPKNLSERATAIRALRKVNEQHGNLLQGILYWKLTSKIYHIPVEPFVMHITPEATDPMQTELVLFTK
mgnify:CR=1 FL=1